MLGKFYVVETNYITQLCVMGFIRGHSFVREGRSEFYEEVERTRHNSRPCCGTHLDLKSLGRNFNRSSQLDKPNFEFCNWRAFVLWQWQSSFSRKNPLKCLELPRTRQSKGHTPIWSFEIVKLQSEIQIGWSKCRGNCSRRRTQMHTTPSDSRLAN